MKTISLAAALLFTACSTLLGSLIPIGPVPLSGTGLGSQLTLLTFTSPANTTTESGCVAGGVGGTVVTGPTACPSGFTGGDEQAINNVYAANEVGIVNFTNLQLIFNASEPGNAADQSITVQDLALTLWNPDNGLILGAFYLESPYVIANPFPGVGNAGFGFRLDSVQVGDANLLLAAFPDLRIGVSSNAIDATGGLETIFVRSASVTGPPPPPPPPPPIIPEPSTYALAISALAVMAACRKFAKP